jgi:hypothetical protein
MALWAVVGPARRRWGRSVRIAAAARAAWVRDGLGSRLEVTQVIQERIDWVDPVAPSGVR